MSPTWIRRSGLVAVIAGAYGLLLVPLVASAYYTREYVWLRAPEWINWIYPLMRPILRLGPPDEVLVMLGRGFVFFYLLLLLVTPGVRACCATSPAGRIALRVVQVGLAMSLIGAVFDFWISQAALTPLLRSLGFALGTELGFLVTLAGSIALGVIWLRGTDMPRGLAWGFLLAPLLGILFSVWGVRHIPTAFVLPTAAVWLALGIYILRVTRPKKIVRRK